MRLPLIINGTHNHYLDVVSITARCSRSSGSEVLADTLSNGIHRLYLRQINQMYFSAELIGP